MPSYPWLSVFREAQEERDPSKLHARVMDAEYAIFVRMQELNCCDGSADAVAESQAIRSALNDLLRIKTEKLNWPSIAQASGAIGHRAPQCASE